MTPELDKYYSNRFEMMGMDGWKDLIIDIDNMIESLNNISVIPDEKTLQFRKGELSILWSGAFPSAHGRFEKSHLDKLKSERKQNS